MIKIAICDDDEREISCLLALFSEYQQLRGRDFTCKAFQSGVELLSDIKSGEYGIILLDIMMPGLNGIQAAREIRTFDGNVKLLFLTSSPEFAVESYAVGAFHYLLKPLKADTLFLLLDQLFADAAQPDEARLTVKTKMGLTRIPFSRLEYVEVLSKTVGFHLTDGSVVETFGALATFEEELLAQPEFLKVHRSYLVNLGQVEALGRREIVTRQNHQVPVSRALHTQVKEGYLRYLFICAQKGQELPAQQEPCPEVEIGSSGAYRILLVDHETDSLVQWANVLQQKGCVADCSRSGTAAMRLTQKQEYDCVLLEVNLQGESGFTLCSSLRELTAAPLVFLSASSDADSQVQGFACGAVDYITKDTPAAVFWAKVETRIRLSREGRTKLCFGPLVLDRNLREVTLEGCELILTPTEFDLLWVLSEHTGRAYAPDSLYQAVWVDEQWNNGQTVQVHMSRLRRKLEKAYPSHFFIKTVWGEGYCFVPAPPTAYRSLTFY